MELEVAIESLENLKILFEIEDERDFEATPKQQRIVAHQIEVVLNHLTKQDKMIKEYEEMIIRHKEQLRKAGIYGYDYDLKVLTEEIE